MRIVRRLNRASSGYELWTVKASLGPAFFLWTKLSAVSDSAALRRRPGFRTRVPRARERLRWWWSTATAMGHTLMTCVARANRARRWKGGAGAPFLAR